MKSTVHSALHCKGLKPLIFLFFKIFMTHSHGHLKTLFKKLVSSLVVLKKNYKAIVNTQKLHQGTLTVGHRMKFQNCQLAGHQWLMPVIPATQEAEIRRIVV
jgi:hypothetical protein